MPVPKVYSATWDAVQASPPLKPLKGTRKAAQSYVDRVTASGWWALHCPGFQEATDAAPRRVWVWEGGPDEGAYVKSGDDTLLHGERIPSIVIGHGLVHEIPAISDRWVILHELAHVMNLTTDDDGHHGPKFVACYVNLVHRFLGSAHGAALLTVCKARKVRLDQGLLSVGGSV